MNTIARRWTRHEVKLDLEVCGSLVKGGMGCRRKYPKGLSMKILEGERETDISGSVTPRSWYAFCRADRQAMRMDSVPPLVVTPAPPLGALKIAST